jgi:adenylate cyclase
MLALQFGWRLGMSHEEAEAVFEEAERLALRAGDLHSRAILLNGYGAVRGVGEGDVREFARLQRQAIVLAEETGDPALYLAIAPGAYALFSIGEYRDAVAMCDRALDLADGDPTVGAGVNYGCPSAWCHGFKGMLLVTLGELDEARHLIEQAATIAREQGDIEVVGFSHVHATYLAYVAGEPEVALSHARQALEIAERIGDSYGRGVAWGFLGLAERMRGEWRQAIEALERCVAIASEGRTAGGEEAVVLAALGESYLGLGDRERAGVLVAEGLELAHAQGNVAGEILASVALARVLLASSGRVSREAIEAALARALELACRTGAKAYEPLVHVELAELARRGGDERRRERELREAHRLFTEIGARGHANRLELGLPTVT